MIQLALLLCPYSSCHTSNRLRQSVSLYSQWIGCGCPDAYICFGNGEYKNGVGSAQLGERRNVQEEEQFENLKENLTELEGLTRNQIEKSVNSNYLQLQQQKSREQKTVERAEKQRLAKERREAIRREQLGSSNDTE